MSLSGMTAGILINNGHQQETLELLSPAMRGHEPYTNHCLMVEYDLSFSADDSSIEIISENKRVVLWGLAGLLHQLDNNTAYVNVPSSVKRLVFVAKLRNQDTFTLKAVKFEQGLCEDLHNVSETGKLSTLTWLDMTL